MRAALSALFRFVSGLSVGVAVKIAVKGDFKAILGSFCGRERASMPVFLFAGVRRIVLCIVGLAVKIAVNLVGA
jgi:hypothetical protein